MDDSGQIIVTDSSSIAVLNAISKNTSLAMQKSVKAVNGIISFTDVVITGIPASDVFLSIDTNSIDLN